MCIRDRQKGGDAGVGGTAEDSHHGHGSRKPGGQAQQRAEHAAKGGTDIKAGDDFAAFKARSQGDRREEDFADKIPGQGLALLHGSGDDPHARAVVAAHPHQVGEGDHHHAAKDYPHPGDVYKRQS